MQFVPVREFRLHPGEVWRLLSREREIILTARGRPIGLLTPVDARSVEEVLQKWRQAKGLLALDKLQAEAKRRGLARLTQRQIQAEIRGNRSRRRAAA